MKITMFVATFFATVTALAQIPVKVSGNIFDAPVDSVYLAQFKDGAFVKLKGAKMKKGEFSIATEVPHPDFYVLLIGESRINLILREASDIKVYGDGKNLNAFCNIVGSEESANMREFIVMMEYFNQKRNEAAQQMQQNPGNQEEIRRNLEQEQNLFISNRQSYIAQNPNSPILLPALTTIDPDQDWALYESVGNQLKNSLPGSPTIEMTYQNFLAIKKERDAANFLAPGKEAPDFEEQKLNGGSMKLSDLRGQVVLLDFWASWCGPCRRENPNVVQLYKYYKDKGFTVMSVSLDQDRSKWATAIEQDGLAWPNHVSDLKGWGSAAGKLYGVRGIPFTVLLDKDGKVIGTNLRGEQLAQTLAQLFGE